MNLTPMDYCRAAISQALAEGLDLKDLWHCAENAETPQALDYAVSTLCQTVGDQGGRAWVDGTWIEID